MSIVDVYRFLDSTVEEPVIIGDNGCPFEQYLRFGRDLEKKDSEKTVVILAEFTLKGLTCNYYLQIKARTYFRIIESNNILGLHIYEMYAKAAGDLQAFLDANDELPKIIIQVPELVGYFREIIDFAYMVRVV